MTARRLRDALVALQRGDDAAAREALIAAWHERRSGALADLIELLDERSPDELCRRLPEIVRPRVTTSEDRLRVLEGVDDPRAARWAIEALVMPPFQSESAAAFLRAIVALAARDPALRDRRADIAAALEARIKRAAMRDDLIAAVDAAVAALAPLRAPTAEELELEGRLADALAPLGKRTRAEDALLDDIYANPDDDAPRLVYADLLLERDDPRGELIRLQLDRGRAGTPSDRERWLIKQHGRDWLGPLGGVLSFGRGYAATRFERGFVAVGDVILSAGKRLSLVLDEPAWATVEKLVGQWSGELVVRAPFRALRQLDHPLHSAHIAAIAARPASLGPLANLRSVSLGLVDAFDPVALRRAFPNLDELVIHAASFNRDDLRRYEAAGVRRLVFDSWWVQSHVVADNARPAVVAILDDLAGTPAFADELAIGGPWNVRPKPAPLELRRGPDGRFVRLEQSPAAVR